MFVQKVNIQKDELLNNISQEEVMFQYLGIWPSLTQRFKSPFRTDTTAGCRFEWKNGLLCFVDNAGFNGKIYWSIFDIVKHVKSCSYREALQHIAKGRYTMISSQPTYKPRRNITFTYKEWQEDNLFKLSNDILKSESVFLVDKYWINKEGEITMFIPSDLCIAYYFSSKRVKLYFPERKEDRWYSNCSNEDIFGLDNLNLNGDLLIISKSQKDRLTLKYHFGYENVIAVQNEGCYIPENIVEDLKLRFKQVVIIFDNDDTGLDQSKKISKKYGFKNWVIDSEFKDPYEIFINNKQLLFK